jgi:hypothetical protein
MNTSNTAEALSLRLFLMVVGGALAFLVASGLVLTLMK